jgi:hypothetical protein
LKPKKEEIHQEEKFTKEQLLKSKRYVDRKDLLNALLKNNESYNLKTVDDLINNFMKGKVN